MSWRRQLPLEVPPRARKWALQQRPSKAVQAAKVGCCVDDDDAATIAAYICHVLRRVVLPRFEMTNLRLMAVPNAVQVSSNALPHYMFVQG